MMDKPESEPMKKVDPDWLNRVEEEKKSASSQVSKNPSEDSPKAPNPHEINFTLFLSTLAMQAYVALGELEDPVSHQKKMNLDQASYMIDILSIIQEKTKGNLNNTEDKMMGQLLYELRVKYLEKSKTGTAS